MIVGLLEAGQTARKVSEDYGLYEGMIRSRRGTGGKEKVGKKGVYFQIQVNPYSPLRKKRFVN